MSHGGSLTKEQLEYLAIINRSGEHLLALINDVLSMAKIESGQIGLNESSFDLYQLLFSIEEMLQLKANAKGLKLRFERSPNLPQYIETDESKLRQVLINLLGNAIKFTETGHVILRVKVKDTSHEVNSILRRERGENFLLNYIIERQISPTSIMLIFEVQDTGLGIAPDEINNLFEPFVQTETGRKSMQGTGLGLSISKQFIRLMGGNISVSSQLGKGTLFGFDISVKLVQHIPEKIRSNPRRVIGLQPNQPSYRILIAEDVKENRQLLIKLLSILGFEVREAENGQEAVALWESWKPHLIWMDMQMPVMDGYEATKKIKQLSREQTIDYASGKKNLSSENYYPIIIAITASAFEEQQSSIFKAGCNDFVPKPFREEELFEKMAQHLGLRYIYADNFPSSSTDSVNTQIKKLTSNDFSVMSKEWVSKLYGAALKVDDQEAVALIQEIPDTATDLANNLLRLIEDFRMDIIMELTEAYINE